jgi:hypothetical protein
LTISVPALCALLFCIFQYFKLMVQWRRLRRSGQ